MAVRVDHELALAIAATAGVLSTPEALPTWGKYVTYNNHYYLLAYRQGEFVAWDISVYDDGGVLVTDDSTIGIYLSALKNTIADTWNSLPLVGGVSIGLIILAAVGYMLFQAWLNKRVS
jgi:hypothetical protein